MKINLKSSAPVKKNKFDISCFHPTTTDFGRTIPLLCRELVPGDKIDLKFVQQFLMSPLQNPTFGNARFLTRAFWVPFRVIEPAWENFIAQRNDTSVNRTLASFTNNDFVYYFVENALGSPVGSGNNYVTRVDDSVAACDIALDYINSGGTHSVLKYNLTDRGRWLYQVLLSLGYSLNWVYSAQTNGVGGDNTPFDMLPIRGFARCLFDYIYPSAYVAQQNFGWLFENPTLYNALKAQLDVVVALLFAPYDQDHFTSAWQSMNAVVNGAQNLGGENLLGTAFMTQDNSGTVVEGSNDNVHIKQNSNSQVTTLSNNGLRILQAISDVLTRHNLVGSRFAERMKARFGFTTKEMKVNQSLFLKSFVIDSQFFDVTNQSSQGEQPLGEMAGKGFANGSGSLEFEASEFGYLIFINQVIPQIGYFQGRAPWTLARAPFEYYNGAYDGVCMRPLRNDELFADFRGDQGETYVQSTSFGGLAGGIFGFQEYYHEYKHPHDLLTGDFRLGSRNGDLHSYHTMRILPQPSQNTPLALNAEFLQVLPNDYDRIFAVGSKQSFTQLLTYTTNRQILVLSDLRACCFRYGNILCGVFYKTDSNEYNMSFIPSGGNAGMNSYVLHNGYDIAGVVESYSDVSNWSVRIGAYLYTCTNGSLDSSIVGLLVGSSADSNYDHFIGYFNFHITAYRNMLSFSESIPMFDKSGKDITTSYEGTQL